MKTSVEVTRKCIYQLDEVDIEKCIAMALKFKGKVDFNWGEFYDNSGELIITIIDGKVTEDD